MNHPINGAINSCVQREAARLFRLAKCYGEQSFDGDAIAANKAHGLFERLRGMEQCARLLCMYDDALAIKQMCEQLQNLQAAWRAQ
ncbi:hypothetical protein QDY71_10505 [Kingella negevensis]|uniref:Uncharacterized protein n=1 Tax=Kingella negevensis TaxID=1522312 RepID=A0A238TBU4_9NEIS|nr:hypothetical protein [Kingella negevensis]MDK4680786.1 hypothetical protein [Kingella negevensis]MDK4681491.1 hypothetical protein [Kingella negevensis]MDK4684225.1 hypothetical protein [Kingella negevensis]MDK4691878.1 hypothetical protein [Kingella negevensis]MDK4692969.1 hypothetical protein [Kingella negevensis]